MSSGPAGLIIHLTVHDGPSERSLGEDKGKEGEIYLMDFRAA